MILIISFIFSFEINKVNPFLALTAPFPLIFLSNLFIAFEVKLLTNPGKLSLAKEISIFVSAFFPKLTKQGPKDQYYRHLSFTKFNICWHIVSKGISYFSCLSCRLEIIHVAILHLRSFSYLLLILFLSYFLSQILICFILHLLV